MEEENKAGLSGWRLKLNVVLHTRVIHRANFSASNMGDFCQEHQQKKKKMKDSLYFWHRYHIRTLLFTYNVTGHINSLRYILDCMDFRYWQWHVLVEVHNFSKSRNKFYTSQG